MAKKKSPRRSASPRSRGRGRATPTKGGIPILPILGAGVAGWLVWNLTKPASASAAELHPSIPGGAQNSLPPAATTPAPAPSTPAGTPKAPAGTPTDPHPTWGLLAQGSQGANVSTWQRVLVNGKFLPASGVDGIFGPNTFAATKALQTKGGVKIDGVVGPDTRRAANALGLWT